MWINVAVNLKKHYSSHPAKNEIAKIEYKINILLSHDLTQWMSPKIIHSI